MQPVRRSMPHFSSDYPVATADYTALRPHSVAGTDALSPVSHVKQQKVFLFDDEIEEEKQKKWEAEDRKRKEEFKKKHSDPDDDLFYDEEEDVEYGEGLEEEDSRGGRIFVKIISVLTAVALVAAIIGVLFATPLGGRLRAQWGISRNYEDYLALALWQERSGNHESASDSYLNVFKLKANDINVSLQVAYGFEACGDIERAEAMYVYLIEHYPNYNEPFDHLMAILYTQNRLSEYEALIKLREQKQPGYEGVTAYAPPIPSLNSGSYTAGSVQLVLTAEKAREIRYTLDDTQPGINSFLYTGPITFSSGSYPVRAVAIYPDGRISEEWSGFYSITSGS